jgi:hypothetical protein
VFHLVHVLVLSLSVIGVSRDGLVMPAKQGAASGLAGRWEGAVDIGDLKLPCAVVFSDHASGLTATIDIQSAKGVTLGTFTLARPGTVPPPARVPPPYHEEEVTFANGPITLAGTLTIPEGRGPFPAFVMVTGSGLQNRDEELFGFKVRVRAGEVSGVRILRREGHPGGVGPIGHPVGAATSRRPKSYVLVPVG